MYGYRKSQSKLKKFALIVLLIITISTASIFLYDMYTNIDVENYTDEVSAIRLSRNRPKSRRKGNRYY